ncbi:hypothetical protein ACX1C1_22925 [Paenibacillus sp. strain BS8-2]
MAEERKVVDPRLSNARRMRRIDDSIPAINVMDKAGRAASALCKKA